MTLTLESLAQQFPVGARARRPADTAETYTIVPAAEMPDKSSGYPGEVGPRADGSYQVGSAYIGLMGQAFIAVKRDRDGGYDGRLPSSIEVVRDLEAELHKARADAAKWRLRAEQADAWMRRAAEARNAANRLRRQTADAERKAFEAGVAAANRAFSAAMTDVDPDAWLNRS